MAAAHLRFVLVLVLCGCTVDARVLRSPEDAGRSDATASNAGKPPKPVVDAGRKETDSGRMQPAADGPPIAMGPCMGEPTTILTDLDQVYDLAVATGDVYAATGDGVWRTDRDGNDRELVVEDTVLRVFADDDALYWTGSAKAPDLHVRPKDGKSAVLLPAQDVVAAVSQDADALYAIADGNLVRVSKSTSEVTTLIDGRSQGGLGWPFDSPATAVQGAYVYFLAQDDTGHIGVDRARAKDATHRNRLMTSMHDMPPLALLLDTSFVYVVSPDRIERVALGGGEPEPFAIPREPNLEPRALAQDDVCIYYALGTALTCISKSDQESTLVLSLDHGTFTQLAMQGSQLYFGVAVASPEVPKASWVGRLACGDAATSN